MKVAQTIAEGESKCISRQVCAIIVQNDRLKSTGHNGTPKGQANCCDVNAHLVADSGRWATDTAHAEHHAWSKKHEVHAEANAILWCAPVDRTGATMYCTLQPCSECSKLIAASGITQVIYNETYDRTPIESINILKDANIEVFHIDEISNEQNTIVCRKIK